MKQVITVLGGSGFIGRILTVRLVRAGYAVRLLTRSRERTKALWTLPNLDVVEVDIYDATQLATAFAGSSAVINLVGIIRETQRRMFERVHEILPLTVVAACAEAGVTRLLHMSALNAAPGGLSNYLHSKGIGEKVVRLSRLQWTIFQPSVVFGSDDAFLNSFARLMPQVPLLLVPSAQTRFQPVYVGDVAEAFCRTLFLPSTYGRVYPLGGPRVYRLDELLRWLGKTIGVSRLILPTPEILEYPQAWLLEHLPGHLMTRDQLRSMQKDSICPGDRESALLEWGMTPTALEDVAPRWLCSSCSFIPMTEKQTTQARSDPVPADRVLARLPSSVRVYEVGGVVRDALLKRKNTDRDHVVIGATPEMMLAAGFRPVGRDFPVFLHPKTQEEYALARAEKKTGRGYHGFTFYTDPGVTLEEDLSRRDLTINAMAQTMDGVLIDPYGGETDLRRGVLRHVSPAFVEDPLRVLRAARFAAQFTFTVADETLTLMRRITESGELATLPAERLWQETARALMTEKPSRFLQVLRDCGALETIMPEVAKLYGVPQKPEFHPEIDAGVHIEHVLDIAALRKDVLPVRYALLCHDLGKGTTPKEQWPSHQGHEERGRALALALSARLKVPTECSDAAQLVTRWHGDALRATELPEEALLTMLMGVDVLRRPQRLRWLIDAMIVDAGVKDWVRDGQNNPPDGSLPAARFLEGAAYALQNVDAAEIVHAHADNQAALPEALHTARIKALSNYKQTAGYSNSRKKTVQQMSLDGF